MNSIVVTTLPISTTNITGFLICTRGSSFLNESGMARRMIFASKIEISPLRRVFVSTVSNVSGFVSVCMLERLTSVHQQVFHDWSKRIGREVGERTYDQDHTH